MNDTKPISFLTALIAFSVLGGCAPTEEKAIDVATLPSPAGPGSAEPNLARGPDGLAVLSWLEPQAEDTALRYSVLADGAWRPARTVASSGNWFVNWADFPSVVPIRPDLWAAHWLVKRPGGTYAYDVAIALSNDAGATWSEPLTPHTDGTPTEHGFVSLFPWNDGVGAMWLDGRNMSGDGHGGEDGGGHGSDGGGMTLRSAIVGPDRSLTAELVVDELVCDCCQTDVAIADSGPVAVFRNRNEAEVRDIYVARAVDGRWETGRPVADDGWEIPGCPVNGPAIAAAGKNVAIAWFTAAQDKSRVRMARSTDGAVRFSAALDIDAGETIGRVDVELLDDGATMVSWIRSAPEGHGELLVRRVSPEGKPGAIHLIAKMGTARRSGFPQMMRTGDKLVFAWTDTTQEASRILSASIDTKSL